MRSLIFILAALNGINAIFMLLAPRVWYAQVPGVTETGPYNSHFVTDIALAFAASSAGLALAGLRPSQAVAALLAPAVFLGGHGLFHLTATGHHGHWLRDGLLVVLPNLLPVAILFTLWRKAAR